MPEFLKEWLQSLSPEQGEQIWVYLDSNKNAVDDMIAVVAE